MSHSIEFNLQLNIEQVKKNIRDVQDLLFATGRLLSRLGLPPNVRDAITLVQALTLAIQALHAAITALYAASGPVGWAMAAIGVVAGAISVAVTIGSVLPREEAGSYGPL